MIDKLVPILLVTGCATTAGLGTQREQATHARVTLQDPAPDDIATRVMPTAIAPSLPSADRIAPVINARLGDRVSVAVELCVSPSGRVITAKLATPSGFPAFDQAVMTDLVDWQFGVTPGPDTVRNCGRKTIVYRSRA